MKQKFLICQHCGNIVAKIRDKGVPVYCCGEKMQELIPGTTEASGEKHIPVYEVEGNTVHVTVGSVEHPMTEDHYIEWVCLETEHGIQYAHLDPDDKPKAKFSICDGDEVRAVYAFCNQHDICGIRDDVRFSRERQCYIECATAGDGCHIRYFCGAGNAHTHTSFEDPKFEGPFHNKTAFAVPVHENQRMTGCWSCAAPIYDFYLQQMLFWVTMVKTVSPNCVSETPNSSNLSWLNWQANQFAMAVMDAVSSQAFIVSPSALFYAEVYSVANTVNWLFSSHRARNTSCDFL